MSLQPFKLPEVASLVWDKVNCQVTFKPDGIHLDPVPKRKMVEPTLAWLVQEVSTRQEFQPELTEILKEASEGTGNHQKLGGRIAEAREEAAKNLLESVERLAKVEKERAAASKTDAFKTWQKNELQKATPAGLANELSAYVFRGHKIPISQRRVTEFKFWTNQDNWTFESPGFWAEPEHEFVGAFGDPEISADGKNVRIRFYPNGPASSFKYNLKMATRAYENQNGVDVDVGHVIIIIDPVMETGEVTV
jgi:hypothetical protein